MPAHGELIDAWEEGPVRVEVRFGCTQRDMYELRAPGPLPDALRDALAGQGELRGSKALYVIDVAGAHQITVAGAQGRLVMMPRMSVPREKQRAHAIELARLVSASLGG